MLFALPIAAFLLVWLHTSKQRVRLGLGRLSVRGAFVVAFVLFEVLVTLITELTSIGHHLSFTSITLAWTAAFVVLLIGAAPYFEEITKRNGWTFGRARQTVRSWWTGQPFEALVAIGVSAVFLLVLVLQGALYPPSNGDSLVYHLPRVVHWIQNHSVAHFATHYLAQVEFAPLSEFNVLHLHLLSGGDRLDGYVQLFCAVVCVVGVSELTRLLGGSPRSQAISAVVCVTIPSLLLEATSTQNNIFAAAVGVSWLVVLLGWTSSRRWWMSALVLGFAVGLGWLSKGTLLPMMAPVALVLVVVCVVPELARATTTATAMRRCLAAGAVGVVGAVIVAGPFVTRNVELFGGPTGPVSATTVSTELSLQAGIANTLRNVGLNFRIGNGRDGVGTAISDAVLPTLERAFDQLDVAPDDPRYFLGADSEAFASRDYSLFERLEDFGANPWHVVLLVAASVLLAVAFVRGARELRVALLVAGGLACGFVLFSATARWSVFATRYEVPLLVAWCPIVALALARVPRALAAIVLVGLIVACSPQILDNATRSLEHPSYDFSSPLDPYFMDVEVSDGFAKRDDNARSFERVARAIERSSCDRLGISNWVLVEYPLWAGLEDAGWSGVIEHIGVTNESSSLEDRGFRPCAVVQELSETPPPVVQSDWRRLTSGTLVAWIAPS